MTLSCFLNENISLAHNELNSEQQPVTVVSLFERLDGEDKRQCIIDLLEIMGQTEDGCDVSEAVRAVEEIELIKIYELEVSVTFNAQIKVSAPDEETARNIVEGLDGHDIITGDFECNDYCVHNYDIDIEECEEA